MTLIAFIGAVILISLVSAWVVIGPWRAHNRQLRLAQSVAAPTLAMLNVRVFEERLAELEHDYQAERVASPDYAEQKLELERQLLHSQHESNRQMEVVPRTVMAGVVIWVPLVLIGAYGLLAYNPKVMSFWKAKDTLGGVAEQLMNGSATQPPPEAANDGIALLQAMQANAWRHPSDAGRWVVMAEGYTAAQAVEQSLESLKRAYRLNPDNPNTAMIYAQTLFFARQGQLDSQVSGIIDHLLQQNPTHEGALMLMSMATYQSGEYAEAIGWVERLRAARLSRGDSASVETVAKLDGVIAQARAALATAERTGIKINVSIDPALRAQIQPTDTLFVFARALQGPPMPYAVRRLPVQAVNWGQGVPVVLSDAQHMMAGRDLSSAKRDGVALVVAARLSKSGNPIGASGDLESLPVPLGGAKQPIELRIDTRHP